MDLELLRTLPGKTIDYVESSSDNYILIHFTDGTVLEIMVKNNLLQLAN